MIPLKHFWLCVVAMFSLRHFTLLLALLMASAVSASAQCDCAGPQPYSCSLLRGTREVFVGTLTEKTPRYRFHVDERLKGVKGDYIDLEDVPCGYKHFEAGKQYVVFVDVLPLSDGEHLYAHECGPTRELKYAQALLEQLRAEKNGKRNASVYGMLRRTMDPYTGIWDDDYGRPLPGVTIRLRSNGKSYETTTDVRGAYQFQRLPSGKYQVSAARLPANLEIAQQISHDVPSFELPPRTCFDNEITALPTGRISGRVIGPNGAPLASTSVDLYRVDQYRERQEGAYAYQGDSKPFEFSHLPGGDYTLVFNWGDQANPDSPYPRTFYPGTSNFRSAKIVQLHDGQQIMDADIHLGPASRPTRKLTVRLLWNGRKRRDYYQPVVVVKPSEGLAPYPNKIAQDSYTLNLFLNATYSLHAEAYCQIGTTGRAESDVVKVDGSNTSVSEVTLTFHGGDCVKK